MKNPAPTGFLKTVFYQLFHSLSEDDLRCLLKHPEPIEAMFKQTPTPDRRQPYTNRLPATVFIPWRRAWNSNQERGAGVPPVNAGPPGISLALDPKLPVRDPYSSDNPYLHHNAFGAAFQVSAPGTGANFPTPFDFSDYCTQGHDRFGCRTVPPGHRVRFAHRVATPPFTHTQPHNPISTMN
jgi:hypothetical protein